MVQKYRIYLPMQELRETWVQSWVGSQRVRHYSATEHTHSYIHVQNRSYYSIWWGFPGGSMIKNLPAMQEAVITEPSGNLPHFLYRRMCLRPTVF